VNPTLDLVVVEHYPIPINRDIIGGSRVNPTTLASCAANGDVGGAIDAGDEFLKVGHNFYLKEC